MQKALLLGTAAAASSKVYNDSAFMEKMLDDMEVYFHGEGSKFDPVYFK
jgi:hypothetical protein